MAEGRRPAGGEQPAQARIIPLGCSHRRWQPAGAHDAGGRTIRPRDVVLLLPFIVPLVAAILLGLLGWFVAWLAVVATLVAAIVFGDLARGLWRRNGALDRKAIG